MSDFNEIARQLLGTPPMSRQQFIDAAVLAAWSGPIPPMVTPDDVFKSAERLADARERQMKGANNV